MAITVIIINCLFTPVEQIKCIIVPHKLKQQSCPRQWVTLSTGVPQLLHWWWLWDTATVWTTTTSSWHLHSLQFLYPQHHIDWYYKQWIPRNWTWLNRTTSLISFHLDICMQLRNQTLDKCIFCLMCVHVIIFLQLCMKLSLIVSTIS